MQIAKHKPIYWGEFRGTSFGDAGRYSYLFGSTVIYRARDHVFFENPLMASGQIIHEWSSAWNFQRDRIQPALPLLKRGRTYSLTRKMTTYPAQGVFLKLIFYNRYEEEVGQLIERGERLDFTYPTEAYSYRVQLLSAGLESFDFHYLEISEQRPAEE
ncbi:accessory Sec system protein Asp3 [Streptococcus oricebi]|uniref:Accessory Sec system protein Asp3 n=1 Tax=Streptococcus oricebi TaxID=1547447 RepID=A0ABS5B4R1_9STRE|nr:accessory Sec system protein Asp3 [Streptococcus oricebi]MBP2622969.1 accessory Sec system protein Asp3 [Streptococcus oricebi]